MCVKKNVNNSLLTKKKRVQHKQTTEIYIHREREREKASRARRVQTCAAKGECFKTYARWRAQVNFKMELFLSNGSSSFL
jgi:hypothetical protein